MVRMTTTLSTLQTGLPTDPGLSPTEERIFSVILIAVNKVLPPFVVLFGLVGTLLAFLVLRQPQYAKQTTCFYMRVIAVFDSLSLLTHVSLRTAVNHNPGFLFGLEAGPIVCPILSVFVCVYGLSNWTVAAMTLDRFLAIRFPLQAASWCTMKRSKITVTAILVGFIVFVFPYTLRTYNPYGLVAPEICHFDPETFPLWFRDFYNVFLTTLVNTAPFFTILIFNVLIIITLVAGRLRKAKEKLSSHNQESSNKDGHITILLFQVTLIFFVTNIPWTIDVWLLLTILPNMAVTVRLARIQKLAYEIVTFIVFINPAVNFYIYCLGCRKFRKDLRCMFQKGFRSHPVNKRV
jgi:hypothetical protein